MRTVSTVLWRLDSWLHDSFHDRNWLARLVCDYNEYVLQDGDTTWRQIRRKR